MQFVILVIHIKKELLQVVFLDTLLYLLYATNAIISKRITHLHSEDFAPFFPAPTPDEKCNVCIQNDRNVSPSKNENMKAALHPSSLSFLLRKERNDRISG